MLKFMEIKIYINLEINSQFSNWFYYVLQLFVASMKLLKPRVTKPKTVEKRWDEDDQPRKFTGPGANFLGDPYDVITFRKILND